jgi:hypothetical protein
MTISIKRTTLLADDIRSVAEQLCISFEEAFELIIGTEDITAYYRILPVTVWDQPNQLSVFEGRIYLNHAENFGDRGAPFKRCLLYVDWDGGQQGQAVAKRCLLYVDWDGGQQGPSLRRLGRWQKGAFFTSTG